MRKATLILILISAFAILSVGFSDAWAQDTSAPDISFIPPSASNGTEAENKTYILWNISFSDDIAACKIEINGTNQTGTIVNATTDSYCYYSETGLSGNVTRCSIAHATDDSGNWNTTLFMVCRNTNEQQASIPDTTEPGLDFVPPTPNNNTYTQNRSWVYLNISASEQLSACLLDNGAANITMTVNYDYCYHNLTGQANGTEVYVWVWANDTTGNLNRSAELNVTINLNEGPDTTFPAIDNYEITPLLVPYGQPVRIGVNASDDEAIDGVWANVTDPSGEHHHLGLANNDIVSWDTNVIGVYSITIFANDTASNTVNVTDSFYVNDLVGVNITVLDANNDGVSTDLEIYVAGTDHRVFWDHESDGEFDASLVEHDYDMLFQAFDDQLKLLFRGVPLVSGFDGSLSLDSPGNADGFEYIFAVETDYGMDDAVITIDYGGMDFENESNVNAYLCSDWDFYDQKCHIIWNMVDPVTRDKDNNLMEFTVNSFSAFALGEDSWCGDGQCGPRETASSCPDDCQCDEGDTRSCGEAHQGICAVGSETCHSNVWFGCPQPTDEACNWDDDDCNGKIDDVDGGASVAATRCQCYDGGTPQAEACNGIDDNCDGFIDNGANCCTNGQERNCGPSTEEGECKFGTSICSGGVFGACFGAAYPDDEICGNGLDDDCDGETDETCVIPPCSEGQINQSCLCEGSARDSGYCCSGLYSEEECVENPWWILIVAGVAILVVLILLILYFKSMGREFTWEELSRRYSGPPP